MKQARVLTEDQIKRVLRYCSGTKHAQRNRLAILLSHYAGLRVGEIASLNWEQLLDQNTIVRDSFYLNAEDTKANEARLVHINDKLMVELTAAQILINSSYGPIIRSQRGGHFSANSLAQVFARLTPSAAVSVRLINGTGSRHGLRRKTIIAPRSRHMFWAGVVKISDLRLSAGRKFDKFKTK